MRVPPGYQPSAPPLAPWIAVPAGAGVLKSPASGAKGPAALARGAGRAVLSSSTGDQRSHLRRDRTMSVFTYHLIEALTGHAQPQEGASEVLVSDLMGHVSRHVPETVSRQQAAQQNAAQQTPGFEISGGNFPVALLLGGEGLAKGARPPDPLADQKGAAPPAPSVQVHTGGGMLVGRNVINRGVIVGRDQRVGGDFVQRKNVSDDDDGSTG